MNAYKVIVTIGIITLVSCNYSILYNPYKIWKDTKSTAAIEDSIGIELPVSTSRFHKSKNEIALTVTLTNRTKDSIYIDRNSFYILSSSGDTAKLRFINTTKFNNSNLLIKPTSGTNVILVFVSTRDCNYEEYRQTFKNDTMFLYSSNIKTDIILKGDYIKKERMSKE